MKSTPLIYVIVVTYKGQRWYERCFSSLRTSNLPVKTIVIDNASNDGSVSYLQEHFPELEIIESSENLGFAKANNIGIRKAYDNGADYIFLLNQDAWVESDTLEKLAYTINSEQKCGIVSPIHLAGDYSSIDDFFVSIIPDEFISDLFLNKLKLSYKVDFVNAAAWLIKREVIEKVGGFDTLLFKHYGEDNNYVQRVHFFGYDLRLVTNSTVCHDRIKRTKNYVQENDFADFNKRRDFRMKFGDIQNEVNFNEYRRKIRRDIVRHLFHFRFQNVLSLIELFQEIKIVEQSRKLSIKGGLIWL